MFVGQLAMRSQPAANKTFLRFLEEVKGNVLKAFENQDYQFDDLTAKLGLQGKTDRHPLFDVIFATFNKNFDKQETKRVKDIGDLKFIPHLFERKTCKTDLRLGAVEGADCVYMTFTYSTALFRNDTCLRMAEHYLNILEQVVAEPALKLDDIKISHQLLEAEALHRDGDDDFAF